MTAHQKIDDDDGHYIVTPDVDLGDRCKLLFHPLDALAVLLYMLN